MIIIHDTWYLLPDGTRVVAVQRSVPPGWRFDGEDRQPLYLWDAREGMRRLEYDSAIDGYHVLPCDLQLADLRAAT